MIAQRKAHPAGFLVLFLALSLAGSACGQQGAGGALASDWVVAAKSQARLIDGGAFDGARYAGAQLRLSGAAVTYWRDPGEAGAPPAFDFAGSENIAEAQPLYPQPERIVEAGTEVFGYRREIVFPIRVTPQVAGKPMVLSLKLDYAACEEICVPVHAEMILPLPAAAPTAPLLAEALRQTPHVLDTVEAASLAEIAPLPSEAGKLRWRLRLLRGDFRDMFVESPAGFFVESRRQVKDFLLILAEHPAKRALPPGPLRITLSGAEPVEFLLTLPDRN